MGVRKCAASHSSDVIGLKRDTGHTLHLRRRSEGADEQLSSGKTTTQSLVGRIGHRICKQCKATP